MTGSRLAAVLAAGQRHLAATGANEASPSVVKRLAKEASDYEKDPIDNVVLVREPWPDAPGDRVPERWSFHVRGQYEIVVELPNEYPFKPPDYKIRIDYLFTDGKLVGLKKYLHNAAMRNPDPNSPFAAAYKHILTPEMMDRLAVFNWSPAVKIRELVSWLVKDSLLQPVLMHASEYTDV